MTANVDSLLHHPLFSTINAALAGSGTGTALAPASTGPSAGAAGATATSAAAAQATNASGLTTIATTQIKTLIQRLIKPIPPPITKAVLLHHLLRMDVDKHKIDRKAFVSVLDICLSNKNDFHAHVIKEVLELSLKALQTIDRWEENDPSVHPADVIPPFAIMRMAILSAKNYPETIGSYVLHTLIPALIVRQIWALEPKVWEGVVMAAKMLAASASVHAESTLKALLGLPYAQLLGVIKLATPLCPFFTKVLQHMAAEDRDALLRAHSQYVAIPAAVAAILPAGGGASTASAQASDAAGGDTSKADKDKERIFKDLLEGKLGAQAQIAGKAATGKK